MVIPKRHIVSLAEITEDEAGIIGKLFLAARATAERGGVLTRGFRTVFNSGPDGGQTVYHLHLHILAGRTLTWSRLNVACVDRVLNALSALQKWPPPHGQI